MKVSSSLLTPKLDSQLIEKLNSLFTTVFDSQSIIARDAVDPAAFFVKSTFLRVFPNFKDVRRRVFRNDDVI